MLTAAIIASILSLGSHAYESHAGFQTAQLSQVTFKGPDIQLVRKDTGGFYSSKWADANGDGDATDFALGDRRAPLCFKRGTDVEIQNISFRSPQIGWFDPAEAQVNGKVNGQIVFTSGSVQQTGAAGEWQLIAFNFTGSIMGSPTIDWWDDFETLWELIPDTTAPLQATVPLGTSDNDVHFIDTTYQLPPLHYSFIDIACRRAAGMDPTNQSNWEAIAVAIYGEFQGGNVTRAQDRLEGPWPPAPLTYYGNWGTQHLTAKDLLLHGDGQCGAWAQFFAYCCHVAGVNPTNEAIDVRPIYNPNVLDAETYFLVNDWVGLSQSTPLAHRNKLNTTWPRMNVPTKNWGFFWQQRDNNLYDFACPIDVVDFSGAPGQATIDPASLFSLHRLIHIGDKLFDPSYGTPPYSATGTGDDIVAGFEQQAIFGYALLFGKTNLGLTLDESDVMCDLDGDGSVGGIVDKVPAMIIQSNMLGNQLKAFPSDL